MWRWVGWGVGGQKLTNLMWITSYLKITSPYIHSVLFDTFSPKKSTQKSHQEYQKLLILGFKISRHRDCNLTENTFIQTSHV